VMNVIGYFLHGGGFLVRVFQWGQTQFYIGMIIIGLILMIHFGGRS